MFNTTFDKNLFLFAQIYYHKCKYNIFINKELTLTSLEADSQQDERYYSARVEIYYKSLSAIKRNWSEISGLI